MLPRSPDIREVWAQAWPTVIAMLSYTAMQFVDSLMVSVLGPVEVAAQGNGGMWSWVAISIAFGILALVNTLVVRSGTRAEQFASATSVCDEAQVSIDGAVVSTTLKLVVHCELLPAASVTVMVMVVEPSAAVAPAKGDCVIVSDELQLSVATTPPVRSGITEAQLAAASSVWFAAHVAMAGAVVSFTVN